MNFRIKSRGAIRLLEMVIGFAVGLFLGCTTIHQAPHVSLAETLIGKSKQDLLACAGSPLREIPTAEGIVLNYYAEAPMFEESFMGSKGSRSGNHHGCWVRISLREDLFIGVEYKSVPTPGIADDHCDEIFKTVRNSFSRNLEHA
ncbi:MAG: hypothetical protein GDA65_15995 [Nitrospira sp. CR1.1]|nr:hypothetical protein [Nitrospira sp. CR1.1]MBA5868545.1 hypothetical protein [Nitrospira sp. CR2.1]